jgi:hypothetical protein
VFALVRAFDGQGEMDLGQDRYVELLGLGEDSVKVLEKVERTFDLVPPSVPGAVACPGRDGGRHCRPHGGEAMS